MAVPTYWTAEMVQALPGTGERREVVWGELLVSPSPSLRHQELVGRLWDALRAYLRGTGLGHLVAAPADLSWASDILVQPDLFVVPLAEARAGEWAALRTVWLVIEVLSPGTHRADRFTKRRLYQEQGVPTYWIVDPEVAAVEVWTPAARVPVVERERVAWQVPGADTACMIELRELFAPLG